MKDIVIVGAGGFGREVAWLIERINQTKEQWNILGFVDDTDRPEGVDGYEVVGDTEWLASKTESVAAVVAVGSSATRKIVCERIAGNTAIEFPNIVDPSVIISDKVAMGRGNIICAGTIATVDITMGDFCIVNLDCTIGHDAIFHDYVTLYPSVNISGCTVLGECVEMGTGSQIIQLKEVGGGTIVGAGAVVNRDLPPKCVAVGIPAKPIKFFGRR